MDLVIEGKAYFNGSFENCCIGILGGCMASRYLRKYEVLARTGLSASTIWRLECSGRFPFRRKIGPNSVGWLESELDEWISSRPQVRFDSVESPGTGLEGDHV